VLDWETKPLPFKVYPALEQIRLPTELPALGVDTFVALDPARPSARPAALDLGLLAALLFFSAGVTRVKTYPGGAQVHFRAAASTGALYQTEVYVVAGDVGRMPPGVHHYSPGDHALRPLRDGDFRAVAAVAAADDDIAAAAATVVLSGLYWRNTWKYGARGYRHLFWDGGTMLANLLAAAKALGVPARIVTGFVEREVNGLLGLDPAMEGGLVLVPVGASRESAPVAPVVAPLAHRVIPLSSRVVDEPLLREAYDVSALDSEAEVMHWRERPAPAGETPGLVADRVALPAPRAAAGRSLGDTILARGSTRRFSGEAISLADLSSALYHATRPVPADVPSELVDLYVAVHAVDGLAAGAYAYRPREHALDPLRAGDIRADSAFLCLEQALGGAGSATVFFLADLPRVLERFGNRGYRLVNLEAGLVGGRLYLGAYAQRFGATGLTFYDDDVVRFFSPHAAGKDAIFVTALGRSVRADPGPIPVRDRLRR
jgi:SagB-type dehydrogenase family enzyme